MKTVEKITVNGETYQICDPTAARLDDTAIGENAWSSRCILDRLCPSFSETGVAVRCEPVEGYPLTVTTRDGATTVTRCGKNRIDYTQAIPRNANSVVSITGGGVLWESGDYYFIIPCTVKAGETVTFSCADMATALSYTTLYDRGTKKACSNQADIGTPMTATADADAIYIYKASPTVAIETPIQLTQLQLECGSAVTAYAPYRQPETFGVGEEILAWSGTNTLFADSGEITVTGKADPATLLTQLMKQ